MTIENEFITPEKKRKLLKCIRKKHHAMEIWATKIEYKIKTFVTVKDEMSKWEMHLYNKDDDSDSEQDDLDEYSS